MSIDEVDAFAAQFADQVSYFDSAPLIGKLVGRSGVGPRGRHRFAAVPR